MTTLLSILAQEAAPQAPGLGGIFVPMILIMGMFYFILIRPQRKAQKAQEELRKGLRVGDKVITIGGIHGIVTGMTDKTVSVKLAESLSVKFDRTAIATVTSSKANSDDTKSGDSDSQSSEKETEG